MVYHIARIFNESFRQFNYIQKNKLSNLNFFHSKTILSRTGGKMSTFISSMPERKAGIINLSQELSTSLVKTSK